jgi:hypothetical protein
MVQIANSSFEIIVWIPQRLRFYYFEITYNPPIQTKWSIYMHYFHVSFNEASYSDALVIAFKQSNSVKNYSHEETRVFGSLIDVTYHKVALTLQKFEWQPVYIVQDTRFKKLIKTSFHENKLGIRNYGWERRAHEYTTQ